MFLENDYVRPLFDNTEGGPAKAFQCRECQHITKTESGMRQHLRIKHNWKEQPCLSLMEECKTELGDPRQLIKGLHLLNPRKNQPANTKKNELQSHVVKEGELLKHTKEEK